MSPTYETFLETVNTCKFLPRSLSISLSLKNEMLPCQMFRLWICWASKCTALKQFYVIDRIFLARIRSLFKPKSSTILSILFAWSLLTIWTRCTDTDTKHNHSHTHNTKHKTNPRHLCFPLHSKICYFEIDLKPVLLCTLSNASINVLIHDTKPLDFLVFSSHNIKIG